MHVRFYWLLFGSLRSHGLRAGSESQERECCARLFLFIAAGFERFIDLAQVVVTIVVIARLKWQGGQ